MKRKQRKAAALLAAVMLAAGAPVGELYGKSPAAQLTAYAADEDYTYAENDTFSYKKFSDHIEISSLKTDPATLEIPSSIDGLPVTVIGIYACQYKSMSSLKLPDTLKEIGMYTFSYCSNLKELTIPDSVTKIRLRAFEKCPSLETINFPDHAVETDEFTFDETPWLTAQRKKNPLVIVNDVVIDGRTCTGAVTVPANVKYVAGSAFAGNKDITSVVFPAGVSLIEASTFRNCENLTSAELKGATQFGYGVFEGCNKLTDLKISGKLKSIDYYTFTDNNATATITFYGSRDTWEKVEKPANDAFLNRATMIFDESHTEETAGDINADGACDKADVVMLLKYLLTTGTLTEAQAKIADMNANGVLNADDLTLLKREAMA
ncbi:MAG: leucine-rich repeat protein [Oscillospiraceae bacterium]|nr:leucine-rich repeat protein [Oscillospiraceae bacterium]